MNVWFRCLRKLVGRQMIIILLGDFVNADNVNSGLMNSFAVAFWPLLQLICSFFLVVCFVILLVVKVSWTRLDSLLWTPEFASIAENLLLECFIFYSVIWCFAMFIGDIKRRRLFDLWSCFTMFTSNFGDNITAIGGDLC